MKIHLDAGIPPSRLRPLNRLRIACASVAAVFVFALVPPTRAETIRFPSAPEPIGQKPHALKPADWEGTWHVADEPGRETPIQVVVTDAAKGRLKFTRVATPGAQSASETTEIEVRESGDWLFANVKDSDRKGGTRYLWWRLKISDNGHLLLWWPDPTAWSKLAREGKLKCRVDDSGDLLEQPTTEDWNALKSGALGAPFVWDEPVVLIGRRTSIIPVPANPP